MDPQPFTDDYQRRKDGDHLNLLSVFHFVVAGLSLFGMGFLALHYFIMSTMLFNLDKLPSQGKNPPPPKEFFEMFSRIMVWFYLFMGGVLLAAGVLNLLSGIFLRQRRHQVFSMVIAGFDCLQIPFGTVLGIFTIVVLSRESARTLYPPENP